MRWLLSLLLWFWGGISFLPRWIWSRWFTQKPQLFRYARVDEFPDHLNSSTVYLAGEGEHLWAAAMICPCGCGEVVELNLLKQARPCWSEQMHSDGTVSLLPSIWRQQGCRSHFFIRHGRIDWC
jgi:hypothetical protein